MSNHDVLVRRVQTVSPHPNADRLELIKLAGLEYTIISAKDNFQSGDFAVFFPEDVILPDYLVQAFNLSFLKKGRVRATKIRGKISEALILPLNEVLEHSAGFETEFNTAWEGFWDNREDLPYEHSFTTSLGVGRFTEEDVATGKSAGRLPSGVEKYDLESLQRYPEALRSILGEYVYVSEKLEGTNFSVHATSDSVSYCSRNLQKKNGIYVSLAQRFELDVIAERMRLDLNAESVTLRGEYFGTSIQKNIYKLVDKDYAIFDIKVNGEYLPASVCDLMIEYYRLKAVPLIYYGFADLFAENVEEWVAKSNGYSKINPNVLREGIVIKTLNVDERIVYKVRSPEYLAG